MSTVTATGGDIARRAVELAEAGTGREEGADELLRLAGGGRETLDDAKVLLYDRVSRNAHTDHVTSLAILMTERAAGRAGWDAPWAGDRYTHKPWIR